MALPLVAVLNVDQHPPRASAVGGSSTTTSPSLETLRDLDAIGLLDAQRTGRALGLAARTTKTSARSGCAPSRMSAAGGTTTAPLTVPTRMRARANRPPANAFSPGISATISKERVRSSTSGVTRTMRPLAREPEAHRPRSRPGARRARAVLAQTERPAKLQHGVVDEGEDGSPGREQRAGVSKALRNATGERGLDLGSARAAGRRWPPRPAPETGRPPPLAGPPVPQGGPCR